LISKSDETRVLWHDLLLIHQLLQPCRTVSIGFRHPDFCGMAVAGVAAAVVFLP